MTRLTEEEKWQIVVLSQQGRKAQSIARRMKVNVKSVRLWTARHGVTKAVAARPPPGRKFVLTPDAVKRATELLLDGESGGSRYVAKKLCSEGYTDKVVAHTTVTRAVKRQAQLDGDPLVAVRGVAKKRLTKATRAKRIAFATANLNRDWSKVMITDRCRFYLRYPGTKVKRVRWMRRSAEDEGEAFKPNKPSGYNVYAGITKYGVTPMHPVTGTTGLKTHFETLSGKKSRNITQAEYCQVLHNTLLPAGRRLFAKNRIQAWELQQDNDGAHNQAQASLTAFNNRPSRSTVSLLQGWPGTSPDLSPIENVWAWVGAEVAALGCKDMAEFKEAVDRTFKNIPQKMLDNLFASLPKRMAKVLERDGHKTGY